MCRRSRWLVLVMAVSIAALVGCSSSSGAAVCPENEGNDEAPPFADAGVAEVGDHLAPDVCQRACAGARVCKVLGTDDAGRVFGLRCYPTCSP